jgi:hypothetical protein
MTALPNLPGNGHMAFILPQQFPATSGNRGLAEFYSANGSLAIIALRANGTGAFTSAPVYVQAGPPVIGTPQGGPTGSVFYEDFSGAFPGLNWIVVAAGGSATPVIPVIDTSTGNPAPSLSFTAGLGNSLQSAVNPFDSSRGLTFSMDVGFPGGFLNNSSRITISVQDQTLTTHVALIQIDSSSCSAFYLIQSANFAQNAVSTTQPFNCDSNFHTFTFRVDAAGNGVWFRDGIQQASGTMASDKNLIIRVAGVSQDPKAGAHVDNISVRVP